MKRFILLSFAFLGWVFYEMSGGASFDATALREARLAAAAQAEAARKPVAEAPARVTLASAKKPVIDTDPPLSDAPSDDVTRVSLNLTTLEPRPRDTAATEESGVPQNVGLVTSSADTPAIIPSLIAPGDSQVSYVATGASASAVPATSGGEDIRTVSGSRVNVRGGPGTDYGVVTKLGRGDAVKVLESDGNGWVRLEPLDGGPGGWMAEFLLADG